MKRTFVIALYFFFVSVGCSGLAVKPEDMDVEISREKPSDDCKEIGIVQGRSINTQANSEEVLELLKKDAQLKGANYVHLKDFSAYGTAARGVGYLCQ